MVEVATSRYVEASADAVFGMLADYWRRPALLPANVTDYSIKRGGRGVSRQPW